MRINRIWNLDLEINKLIYTREWQFYCENLWKQDDLIFGEIRLRFI